MRAVGKADRGGGAAHLLAGDDMLEITETETAKLLVNGDAVQAEHAHFRPQLPRQAVLRINPRGKWRDAIGSEAMRGVADHVRILTELKI